MNVNIESIPSRLKSRISLDGPRPHYAQRDRSGQMQEQIQYAGQYPLRWEFGSDLEVNGLWVERGFFPTKTDQSQRLHYFRMHKGFQFIGESLDNTQEVLRILEGIYGSRSPESELLLAWIENKAPRITFDSKSGILLQSHQRELGWINQQGLWILPEAGKLSSVPRNYHYSFDGHQNQIELSWNDAWATLGHAGEPYTFRDTLNRHELRVFTYHQFQFPKELADIGHEVYSQEILRDLYSYEEMSRRFRVNLTLNFYKFRS